MSIQAGHPTNEKLDSSLAERLLKEAQEELMINFKKQGVSDIGLEMAGAEMGTGAVGPSIVARSSDGGLSTEAIRNELKMLDRNDNRRLDQFNQV